MKLPRSAALGIAAVAALFASLGLAAPASAGVTDSPKAAGDVASHTGQVGPLTSGCWVWANPPYSWNGRIWASGNVNNCNNTWKHACVVLYAIYPGYGGIPEASSCIDITQGNPSYSDTVLTSWPCPGGMTAYETEVLTYDSGWHIKHDEWSQAALIAC